MIIYNVTVNIEDSVHDEWLKWMQEVHLPDVLKTKMFLNAHIFKLLTQPEEVSGTSYAIQYECETLAKYELYQKEYAPALQQEHTQRYKGKFVAFRSILEKVGS